MREAELETAGLDAGDVVPEGVDTEGAGVCEVGTLD